MTQLRSGILQTDDLERLLNTDLYARHTAFNDAFLARHRANLENYGKLWGRQPLGLWSRRWEYPYTYSRVTEYSQRLGRTDLKILDAGSGVTYLPYLLTSELGGGEVTCCDYDTTYAEMFAKVNANETDPHVDFVEADLRRLPMDDDAFDAVCCVSVLEHTDQYRQILAEFDRVLKPGGLLALTFDLSLDEKFQLRREQADELLRAVVEMFDPDLEPIGELGKLDGDRSGMLTTDHVSKTNPGLLPWTYPRPVMAAYDLVKGRGWTGGFRSKAVFCLSALARSPIGAGT